MPQLWGGDVDHLAALFLAEPNALADVCVFSHLPVEAQRERWLRILRYIHKIRAPLRRKRASKRVHVILKSQFSLSGGVFRVAPPLRDGHSQRGLAKQLVQQMVDHNMGAHPEYAKFIRRNTRVGDGPEVTFKKAFTSLRKVAATASFSELSCASEAEARALLCGADTRVLEENWDVPLPVGDQQAKEAWDLALARWSEHFGMAEDATSVAAMRVADYMLKTPGCLAACRNTGALRHRTLSASLLR